MAMYGGQLILLMGEEMASSLPVSMSYPTLAIPVGGALFMLHSLTHIVDTLRNSRDAIPVARPHAMGD